MAFLLEVRFEEEQIEQTQREGAGPGPIVQTKIQVAVAPRRNRDRRRANVASHAREMLASFRSYLMATEVSEAKTEGVFRKARSFFIPRFGKR
jgi:hypothetical protein